MQGLFLQPKSLKILELAIGDTTFFCFLAYQRHFKNVVPKLTVCFKKPSNLFYLSMKTVLLPVCVKVHL